MIPWAKSKIGVFLLISIVSGVIYSNSLDNGFHFDDKHHIIDNKYLRSLNNIPLFFVDINTFSGTYQTDHYRPLILISYTINYYFNRLNPVGYHLVNLLFHVGTAFSVFLIVQAMLNRKAFFAAMASGLIFAVHPFNSEGVNYITARSSVMSTFFYLLSFYCWVRYRGHGARGTEHGSQPSTSISTFTSAYFYIASLLAYLLGLLTKETLITLPIILWLYDLYFPRVSSSGKKNFLLYTPYILFVSVPYILLKKYFAGTLLLSGKPVRGYYMNLLMETKVLVKYLYLLFFPVNLSIDHPIFEVTSILDWKVLGSILLLMIVIGLSLYLSRNNNYEWRIVSFFILWFFITMLPTTIIPLNAPLQENRGYLAGVGFSIFLGMAISRSAMNSKYRKAFTSSILILIIVLYSLITFDRNSVWKEDFTLWLDASEKLPMSWRAHYSLGNAYYRDFRLTDLAINEYKKAIEAKGDYYEAMDGLGYIYLERGEFTPALIEFEKAIAIEPAYIEPHINLARVYMKLGRKELAKKECELVVKLAAFSTEKENESVIAAQRYLKWLNNKEDDNIIVTP